MRSRQDARELQSTGRAGRVHFWVRAGMLARVASNAAFFPGSPLCLRTRVFRERAVSENYFLFTVRGVDGMAGIAPILANCAPLGVPLPHA